MTVSPNRDQFLRLAADSASATGEVVMLNLLKFAESGEASYARYADVASTMIEARGGRILWTGTPDQVLIGDVEADAWDAVVLVSYPSRSAFLDMISQPEYQDAGPHRERGLERTVLLAMSPAAAFAANGS